MRSSRRLRGDILLSGKNATYDARRDLFIDLGVARWPPGSWAILGSPRAPKIAPPTRLVHSIDCPLSVGTRQYPIRRNIRRDCGAAPGASMLLGKNGGKHPKSPPFRGRACGGLAPNPRDRKNSAKGTTQALARHVHRTARAVQCGARALFYSYIHS